MWLIKNPKDYAVRTSLFQVVKNVFSVEEIELLEDLRLKYYPLHEATILQNPEIGNHAKNDDIRNSNIAFIDSNYSEFDFIFRRLVDISNYVNNKVYNFDLHTIEPLQYTIYNSSHKQYYGKHIDSSIMPSAELSLRKLSLSILLSDTSNFTGGKLLFHDTTKTVEAQINKGDAVIFPSLNVHEVTPVEDGERRSLVAWISGPNWK